MPNDLISSIGQEAILENGKLAVSRPTPAIPEEKASTPATTQKEPPIPHTDPELVKQAAEQISKFIQSNSRNLQFTVDQSQRRIIVKVLDKETGEVIRQIPGEDTLAIAKSLDTPKGVLIQSKA